MLDESSSRFLVESHGPLFGLRLQRFDLFKVLLDAGQFPENGVVFGIDAMETQVGCPVSITCRHRKKVTKRGIQKMRDSNA